MSTTAQRSLAAPAAATNSGGEARLRVSPADPAFADAVLLDVLRIRRTAAGRSLFSRLRAAKRVITIEKPNRPTDPPNAWTQPRLPDSPSGTEIVIAYNPADWPSPAWPGSPPSDAILFARLEDAVAIASGAEHPGEPGAALSPAMDAYLRERTAVPEPSASLQP